MRKQLQADFWLTVYSIIMGITSLVIKVVTQELGVYSFMVFRYSSAFLICLVFFYRALKGNITRSILYHSLLIGIVTYGSHLFCTIGIYLTPVGIAGFLTNLQPIVVPILIFLRTKERFDRTSLLCIAGVFLGVCLITLGNEVEYTHGVWLCIVSSICTGMQITLTEKYVNLGDNAIPLTTCQLGVLTLFSLLACGITKEISFPHSPTAWMCIAWTGFVSTAFATYIHTRVQKDTSSVRAGLIFSSIPIFCLIGSRIVFHDSFTIRACWGAALMVVCIAVMELNAHKKSLE